MVIADYWAGFVSEITKADAGEVRKCVSYSKSAVDHLLQYQQSLKSKQYFQAYLDWSMIASEMPNAVDGCSRPLTKPHPWWTSFSN